MERKLHEACGVFGLYNADGLNVAEVAYMALHAQQHRGQDGAGIAATDGKSVSYHKDVGLVTDVFGDQELAQLKGKKMVMGHVRYATSASAHNMLNTQPIVMHGRDGFVALAHNGHLVNGGYLRSSMQENGQLFQTEVDSEILMHLVARDGSAGLEHGVAGMMKQVRGSYSLVMMTRDKLIGVRDPWGLRPLALGRLGNSWMLASESCAFVAVGGCYEREVRPGEIVVIDQDGLRSIQTDVADAPTSLCVFEYVYFARSDSRINGVGVYSARRRMGELLSRVAPVEADVVAGVPDSAIPAAMGYAEASGIPFGQVLLKNRYTGRTFITAGQQMREKGVRMKLSTLRGQCMGRRIVLVDDSIVRGTNSRQLVNMLRQAGAKEVHLRIASPPVTHPCHFGINTPTTAQLIGAKQDVEQVRQLIGADSLAYLDLAGLERAVNGDCPGGLCTACFSGEYPMPIKDTKLVRK